MNQPETTRIEINGIKLDVDLRTARRVDTLQVGSRVKCLVKTYSGAAVYPGVVIGFEPFPSKPTIQIAYLDMGYGSEMLKFCAFNEDSKDFEIVPDIDNSSLECHKADILVRFQREIEKKQMELDELQQKRRFFLENLGRTSATSKKSPSAKGTASST